MSGLRVLETLLSLSLQVALLAGATGYLARRRGRSERGRDALWNGCLAAFLLLALGAFMLPHLRLLPVAASQWETAPGDAAERLATIASAVGIVWGLGAVIGLVRLALGILHGAHLLRHTKPVPTDHLPEPWGTLGLRNVKPMSFGEAPRRRGRQVRAGVDRPTRRALLLAIAAGDDRAARGGATISSGRNRRCDSPRVGAHTADASRVAVCATRRRGPVMVSPGGALVGTACRRGA